MAYSMAVKIPNFRLSLIPTNMREQEKSDQPMKKLGIRMQMGTMQFSWCDVYYLTEMG